MPIQPLLDREGNVFGPEDIKVLTAAFNAALAALQLVDRTVLRDRVIESFKTGPANSH